MAITGTQFESLVKPFFRQVFNDMGYTVIEVRNQTSGTQNGFDIKIVFQDQQGIDRSIFIECKYYESNLSYAQIVAKIIELSGSNYTPDAFIALSPKRNLSNIDDNLKQDLEGLFKFPCDFWTPDFEVKNIFALDPELYEVVYDDACTVNVDRDGQLEFLKNRIEYLLGIRETLLVSHDITINEADSEPYEELHLRTNLDEKLDAVFDPEDERRIRYHQYRCNYKVYLEGLQDVNNVLRNKIMDWQDNLRIKAERLTGQFNTDPDYTPAKFFFQFFQDAEASLRTFYISNELSGSEEKLLHGAVLELAAQCPLDWRPNGN